MRWRRPQKILNQNTIHGCGQRWQKDQFSKMKKCHCETLKISCSAQNHAKSPKMAFLDAFCWQNSHFCLVFSEFSVREPFSLLSNTKISIIGWGRTKINYLNLPYFGKISAWWSKYCIFRVKLSPKYRSSQISLFNIWERFASYVIWLVTLPSEFASLKMKSICNSI